MNTEVSVTTKPPVEFDLGTLLGRRQAFSMVAGKASAADVECLRQIRDRKLYKAKTANWGDFCAQYLGASKSHIDSEIRYLLEYGPQYFELAQITRISPDAYRAMAQHVTSKGLEVDGEVIPLVVENSHRLAAGVAELRKRAGKPAGEALPSAPLAAPPEDVFPDVERRIKRLIEVLGAMPRFQKYNGRSWSLVNLLETLRKTAKERGAPIDL
jgi:hypothetical protein